MSSAVPSSSSPVAPLSLKPDLAEAYRRWQAYLAGDLLDRPIVCVMAPLEPEKPQPPSNTYHDRVFRDIDDVIDRVLAGARATWHGGEAIPTAMLSIGPDEVGCFCGADLKWHESAGDTNWSVPSVEDWDAALPLGIREDNALWQRVLALYCRAAERLAGHMLLGTLDLHTNMDLLASVRGPQRLCMDLLERPEAIDRAMASARAVFPAVWNRIAEAGRMAERGFCHTMFSPEGAACLQCDFSCMMSPADFRRWVLPALEEEAALVRHVIYHWDGPGALVHADALIASPLLHTLSYVPGTGHGSCVEYVDLYRRVQAGGKGIEVWGSFEELQQLHRALRPEKAIYKTWAASPGEGERILEWFRHNT